MSQTTSTGEPCYRPCYRDRYMAIDLIRQFYGGDGRDHQEFRKQQRQLWVKKKEEEYIEYSRSQRSWHLHGERI